MIRICLIIIEWLGLLVGLVILSVYKKYVPVCIILSVLICMHLVIWDLERLREKIRGEIIKSVNTESDDSSKINETIN